jgi:hypothetical protein
MGQHQHGDIGGQRTCDLLGLDQLQGAAALPAQRLGDVKVGREVAAFADEGLALRGIFAGHVQRGAQHLEQVDGGAVGGHHFVRAGAHEAGNLVAGAPGCVEPARTVPAADQALAPFLRHHFGHAGGCGLGQDAERVAIEINHARGQVKLMAQVAQGVLCVELSTVFEGLLGHGKGHERLFSINVHAERRGQASSRSTARTGLASAVISFRGSAISS